MTRKRFLTFCALWFALGINTGLLASRWVWRAEFQKARLFDMVGDALIKEYEALASDNPCDNPKELDKIPEIKIDGQKVTVEEQ